MSSSITKAPVNHSHRLWRLAVGVAGAVLLSGCASTTGLLPDMTTDGTTTTGSINPGTGTASARASRSSALAQAREARRAGQPARAYALLRKAAGTAEEDAAYQRELGLLALESGRPREAHSHLEKAMAAGANDWHVHSANGAALASLSRHGEAQKAFARALAASPDNPAVMNNQAMSLALNGRIRAAEAILRRAEKKARSSRQAGQIRQNLALVLGLSGKLQEGRRIAQTALPPKVAESNFEVISAMKKRVRVSRRSASHKPSTRVVTTR